MAERTDPSKKVNHPFYCQYRAVLVKPVINYTLL